MRKKLCDVASIRVGYQARGRIAEDLAGSHCIIRPQDFERGGEFQIRNALRFYPNLTIDPEKYLVHKDDILLQARGIDHQAILISQEFNNTVAANSFYIIGIEDKKRIVPEYLVWWLNQDEVQRRYFEKEQGLSTIPFISIKVLSNTPLLLPDVQTQKKIQKLIVLWKQEKELLDRFISKKDKLIGEMAKKIAMEKEDR